MRTTDHFTPQPGRAPRKRVLLVDDEAAIRMLIIATLGSVDFELIAADCGQDALLRASEVRPDLVLLDVTMSDLDGFAVAASLRASPVTAHVPIVMLTARSSAEDLAEGARAGATEYLIKPFSPLHLLDTVYGLLGDEAGAARPRRGI